MVKPEPVVERAAKRGVERVAKPAVERAAKPVVGRAAKPAVERAAKPVVERAAEPQRRGVFFSSSSQRMFVDAPAPSRMHGF